MTRTTHSLRHAGTALAAVLAIASTPSLAQDAAAPLPAPEPVIVVPDIPAAAVPAPTMAPQPTIVVPTNQPVVQPVPEPTAEAPEPAPAAPVATTTRTRVTAPAARTAPEPVARAETPAPAAVEETTILPPIATTETVAEPVAPVATAEPAPTARTDNTGILALVLGGLVFLALAIWGFIAIGRRKPVRRYAAAETTVASPAPVAPAPVVAAPAPVVAAPVAIREPVAEPTRLGGPSFASRTTAPSGALPHTGAAVALPRTLPDSFEEREELFRRMVDAKPDRANPFVDRRARMKRARLIMQSIGRDFGDVEPWIDLSQYPNNWPELARKRSAAA